VNGMDQMLWTCGGIAIVAAVLGLAFLPRGSAAGAANAADGAGAAGMTGAAHAAEGAADTADAGACATDVARPAREGAESQL
jgi:hypothetical protein